MISVYNILTFHRFAKTDFIKEIKSAVRSNESLIKIGEKKLQNFDVKRFDQI